MNSSDNTESESPPEKGIIPLAPLEFAGSKALYFFQYLGQLARLTWYFFHQALVRPVGLSEIRIQCEQIGLLSLPIAAITMLFVGLVFAFQFGMTLRTMGAVMYIGKVASLSVVRELGPAFTSLVVGGRVGAGMAAELGSMRVTEQIDAIRALGANPYKKLLVPRVIATSLMMPIVTIIASVVGIFGAMMISWLEFNVNPVAFYNSAVATVTLNDMLSGFSKPLFFGFGIAVIGCHQGFECGNGTVGVGQATTRAVVNVSLMVVFADFVLTRFFAILPDIGP